MWISVNGTILDEREAVVSVYDHGFLYGMGLFETFRTYGGKPFMLREHLQRLAAGCAELGFRYEPDELRIRALLDRLLKQNDLSDAYIRYTLTGGTGPLGLPGEEYKEPAEIIYMKELPALPDKLYLEGKPLQLLQLPRNTPEGACRLKSLHYMNNILAKRELVRYRRSAAEGAEGLMLTRDGFIAEGSVSNVFWARGGIIHTPSVETGILAGITRAAVISAAQRLGLPVEEGFYGWDDLLQADEAFLTSSIQELVPVHVLYGADGSRTPLRTPGMNPGGLTEKLLAAYRQSIAERGNGE